MLLGLFRVQDVFRRPIVWLAMLFPLLLVGNWLGVYWPSSENSMNAIVQFSPDFRSIVFTSLYLSDRKSNTANSKNFQLDLETDILKSISDIDSNRLIQNTRYRMTLADEGNPSQTNPKDSRVPQIRKWTVWCKETDAIESSYQIELPGEPRFVNDKYILVVTNEKFLVWKLDIREATPVTLEVVSNNAFVISLPNSSRFVFWAQGLSSPTAMSEVYEITDNEIRKLGEWPKSALRSFNRMGDQDVVVISKPDGTQEVRGLETNEVISINIDPSIDLKNSPWSLERDTNTVSVMNGIEKHHFEFGSWRRIPGSGVEGVNQLVLRQPKHDRAYYASNDLQNIVCIQDRSGDKIWSRENIFPESLGALGFRPMGDDKLLIHGHSQNPEAVVLDSATGATLSKSQPLWAIRYVLMGWSLCMAFWWIGWFARSVRDGGWAWLDCTCFLAFVVIAMACRVLWSGDPLCDFRIEYRIAQGASAAGLALTSLWIIFGQTRWTLKLLPPLAWIAFICSVVMTTFGLRSWAAGATLVTLSIVLFWMLSVGWLFRRFGWRLANTINGSLQVQRESDRKARYPLRDIFLVTIAVAIFFSVIRFVPIPKLSLVSWQIAEGALNCLLMALNTYMVAWCALSNRPVWVRWILLICSPLLCALAGVAFQAWLYRSNNYPWMAAYHGVVQTSAAAVLFMALQAYRWRGWRLGAGQGGEPMAPPIS